MSAVLRMFLKGICAFCPNQYIFLLTTTIVNLEDRINATTFLYNEDNKYNELSENGYMK